MKPFRTFRAYDSNPVWHMACNATAYKCCLLTYLLRPVFSNLLQFCAPFWVSPKYLNYVILGCSLRLTSSITTAPTGASPKSNANLMFRSNQSVEMLIVGFGIKQWAAGKTRGELSCSAVLFNLIKESWHLARKVLSQFKLLSFLNVFGNTLLTILLLEIAKKTYAAGSAEHLNSPLVFPAAHCLMSKPTISISTDWLLPNQSFLLAKHF